MRADSSDTHRAAARSLVEDLQQRHVRRLQDYAASLGLAETFTERRWHRSGGRHGGGTRWVASGDAFARASVNVSFVHYDDMPEKALASATALSAIVHPADPRAPSLHLHLSWTALKSGTAYWRVMADLNPSTPRAQQTQQFLAALQQAAGDRFDEGTENGDRYFFIPALGRHRGVAHFYLEGLNSGSFDADLAFGRRVERTVIDTYRALLADTAALPPATAEDHARQRSYHTLYLFQVLTLDRGTTSGILVHSDNDTGILGSLPPAVDTALLAEWKAELPAVQRPLVDAIIQILEDSPSGEIDDGVKQQLAQAVRTHYTQHPEALAHQARGRQLPPTVANHR